MDSLKIVVIFLGFLTVLAVGAVLHLTSGVMIPLITAVLFSFVLSPVVEFLRKKVKIPRPYAILFVIAALLGVGFLIGLFFYSSLLSLYGEVPKYTRKFILILDNLVESLRLPGDVFAHFSWTRTLSGYLFTFSRRFMDFLASLVLMVLFLIFLLLERPYIKPKMMEAFHAPLTHRLSRIYIHIAEQIGRFLSVKLFISLITGFVGWLTFWLLGVDFAVVWGVMIFFFNFIPSIGSIIITVITGAFTIVQFYPSWTTPLAVIIIMVVVQQIMGNLIEPSLLGDLLNLSPVIIIFSLLIWGWLWGIVGMFLAVPITVALKIVCENIPALNSVAVLMGTGQIRRFRNAPKKSA